MEYILYCDESSSKGEKYSDFFGGCIVRADRLHQIEDALNAKKAALNLSGEIKWTKVTENYRDKYCEMMRLFFEYIRSGDIRVRIMFRKTADQYISMNGTSKDDRYFKLYYQFIKHSFGFSTSRELTGDYFVHILLDELPDHSSTADEFKDFIVRLPATLRDSDSGLHIRKRDIGEVRSHDHVLLQCTDIVLGSMYFRLNNLHQRKESGQWFRGKRTRAKETVYKCIQREIAEIHPNFNIGVSTGARGYENPHWENPYEHWLFIPNKQKGCPSNPTENPA